MNFFLLEGKNRKNSQCVRLFLAKRSSGEFKRAKLSKFTKRVVKLFNQLEINFL